MSACIYTCIHSEKTCVPKSLLDKTVHLLQTVIEADRLGVRQDHKWAQNLARYDQPHNN